MRFWQFKLGISLVFFSSISIAQETHLELLHSVKLSASFIESDNIGNVYTVHDFEITKRDISGKELLKNSALAFGDIYSLDASNALKMVLFFKDMSQVIYLDNLLANRGNRVELDFIGYSQVTAICRSYNDGLWVYDQTTFELTRLDEQLQSTAQSGNLNQILGFVPNPTYIRESNNWVYINDPEHGVMVFDWYGSYTKTIPVLGLRKFVIRANKLFYLTKETLDSYDLKSFQFSSIQLPSSKIVDFTLYDDKLLLITENELLVYRIIVN